MYRYLAQTAVGGDDPSGLGIPNLDENNVVDILIRAGDWMFAVFLIVAIISIIIVAFKYLTAGGNEGKIREANQSLVYAVSAIAAALLAWGIIELVAQLINS